MDVQDAREKIHRNTAVWLHMRGFKKHLKKEDNLVLDSGD